MKVNDYVKVKETNEVFKIVKQDENMYGNELFYDDIDALTGYVIEELTLLTPEETLEYFKGRFEKLGCEFRILSFKVAVISKGIFSVCMNDNNDWEMRLQDNEEYEECVVVDVVVIDLIREFQQWYWRDK